MKTIDMLGLEIERLHRAAMGTFDTRKQYEEIQKQIDLSSSFSIAQDFLNQNNRWKNEIDQLTRLQHPSFDHLATYKSALGELSGSTSAYEAAKRLGVDGSHSAAMSIANASLGNISAKLLNDSMTTRQLLEKQLGRSSFEAMASAAASNQYFANHIDTAASAASLAWHRSAMAATAGLQSSFALAQAVGTASIEKAIANSLGGIASQFEGQLDFKNRLQELVGGMSTFDLATTASLARYHGVDGLARQMASLGLEPSRYLGDEDESEESDETTRQGVSFEHSALAVTSLDIFRQLLINIIAAYIWALFIAPSVPNPDLEAQNKKLAKIEALVEELPLLIESQIEAILLKELQTADVYFVVQERTAKLRTTPQSGSGVLSLAFPNQKLKLIEERGKWIRVEFYDYLAQTTREGWVLKKYCHRLPLRDSDFARRDLDAAIAATRADIAAGRMVQESPEAHLARLGAM